MPQLFMILFHGLTVIAHRKIVRSRAWTVVFSPLQPEISLLFTSGENTPASSDTLLSLLPFQTYRIYPLPMYNYTSATLAVRAKCSLSHYYFCLPNDQPHCFRRRYCHFPCNDFFPASPFTVPSRAIILSGRLRVRVFCPSPDSELMDLLAEPEEKLRGSEELGWKSGRREVEIKEVVGSRRGSKKEVKEGMCLSRSGGSNSVASPSSTFVRDSELSRTGRRRPAGESLVGYSNSKNITKFDAAIVAEEEVREVQKYVDDSWRQRRHSLKKNFVLDSTKDDSVKKNDILSRLGAKAAHENADQRTIFAQQVNSRENESNRRSHNFTRISEIQSDNVQRTPVLANVRRTEKGESSASAAWQNSDVDHGVVKHVEYGVSQEKQSQLVDFNYTKFQNAVHSVRDFHEKSVRGREEQTFFEQNSPQIAHDKIMHLDQRVEQDESTRNSQRLSEVSVFNGNDFGKASCIDDRRLLGVDARTNLVPNSGQVLSEKMSQMALQRHVGSKSKEKEEKLAMEGNSMQLRIDEEKQIHRRVLEHEKTRSGEMHSEVSEIRSSNLEESSLFKGSRITGMESKSGFVQISIPATKDKATQVDPNEAYCDQTEDSLFNTSSSWIPSDSRVNLHEYNTLLDLNQATSLQEKYKQANKQAYNQANEFGATRSNNRRVSSLQEDYNLRLENKTETSSAINLLLLTREEEMQRSSLTRKDSKSASMQTTSTESLNGVSSSQPTYSELNVHAGRSDILQNQQHTNESADLLQKEIVYLNKSGKTLHDSSRIQIEEPGGRGMHKTLIVDNRKETFSTELNQERKERNSSLFLGESSQSMPMRMTSASLVGAPSSLKTRAELDYDGGRDGIQHITDNAIESAKQFDKYSAYLRVQTEKIVHGESQATDAMQVGELNERRNDGDTRFINQGGRLSPSELGMKGPSDVMWDVQGLSSQGTSKAKEIEEEFPTSGAIVSTTPTPMRETRITRRSPKSLWSYVTDIIRMNWVLRGRSHSSTHQSDTHASSNESITSEAWFSGHEPDEVWSGDESRNEEKISLLKELTPVKESDEHFFEKSKKGNELAAKEPNLSFSSGVLKKGLSNKNASSPVEAEHLASKADAALPSTTGIVESRVRDKVKVLKPSSSYPAAMMKIGFSSSITQPTDVEKIEAAQVREGNNSGLEVFEQPSTSIVDSILSGITDTEEVHIPGNGPPKVELVPFKEKPPEVGGIKESGMKQRKFQRNKQVLREQFDEWEDAFKLDNEQKKIDEIFMKEAILEARKGADTWEVPVGAVLVQNGKIIARSCNL
ncbi:hypothetical protein KSP40_PGU009203 [Platanthera guangdongensis]|uniref:CMP/dCMP-type deaminase domain-containing protein n=1 Tax=Platanthera guangdongensis TaxID=2320717 RepID=A0ABR2LGY4_9ASPA